MVACILAYIYVKKCLFFIICKQVYIQNITLYYLILLVYILRYSSFVVIYENIVAEDLYF